MDAEQTPRVVVVPTAADRARAVIAGRPILSAVLLTLAWYVVLFALAEAIGSLQPHWFPDLGYTLVNLGAAAVPMGSFLARLDAFGCTDLAASRSVLVAFDAAGAGGGELLARRSGGHWPRAAQRCRPLHRARDLGGIAQPRSGATGIGCARPGSGGSRGGAAVRGGPHAQRYLVLTSYRRHDTLTINAAAFGFAFAALRWHLRTIWPLVGVHALGDFLQILSPGNLPFGVRVAYLLGFIGYGWWLLRRLPGDATGVTPKISPTV